MNKITIELCAEDRARLDNILETLKSMATVPCVTVGELAGNEQTTPETPAAPEPVKAEPVAQAPAAPEAPEPVGAETAPEVTAAELQSKVVQLVSAGKKDATRAVIMEYAKSVGEIPADKRAEVLERLNALEG